MNQADDRINMKLRTPVNNLSPFLKLETKFSYRQPILTSTFALDCSLEMTKWYEVNQLTYKFWGLIYWDLDPLMHLEN